jgi:hypothetical protein
VTLPLCPQFEKERTPARTRPASAGRPRHQDPNAQHSLGNPVKFNDPSGHIPVETVADFIDIGWSAYDLWNEPSWGNAGLLLWSVGATFIPYVPGAWVAKIGKVAHRGLKYAGEISGLKNKLEHNTAIRLGEIGLEIIGLGDEGVKATLGLPGGNKSKAADFLARSEGGRFYIVETKETLGTSGAEVDNALLQIESTLNALSTAVPDAKIGQIWLTIPPGGQLKGNYEVRGDLLFEVTDEGAVMVRRHGHPIHVKEVPIDGN